MRQKLDIYHQVLWRTRHAIILVRRITSRCKFRYRILFLGVLGLGQVYCRLHLDLHVSTLFGRRCNPVGAALRQPCTHALLHLAFSSEILAHPFHLRHHVVVMCYRLRRLPTFLHLPERPFVRILELIDPSKHSVVHALMYRRKMVLGRNGLCRRPEQVRQGIRLDTRRVVSLDAEERFEIVPLRVIGCTLECFEISKSGEVC
jgi:hypothetical protein